MLVIILIGIGLTNKLLQNKRIELSNYFVWFSSLNFLVVRRGGHST